MPPTEDHLVEIFHPGLDAKTASDFLTGCRPNALAQAAAQALSTEEVPSIAHKNEGESNRVFVLEFPQGKKKVLARVARKRARLPCRIAHAVATMSYAHHVLGIPTPHVYAWNDSCDNPVGAPYILQEYIEDVVEPWRIFVDCTEANDDQQSLVIDELARWHPRFLTPLPPHLNCVGDLGFAPNVDPKTADLTDPFTYVVQPLHIRLPCVPEAEPKAFRANSTSLASLWDELWDFHWNSSLSEPWPGSFTRPGKEDRLELDRDDPEYWAAYRGGEPFSRIPTTAVEAWLAGKEPPAPFSSAAHNARTFIHNTLSRFRSSSTQYSASCLVRDDYAFGDVLLDRSSLRVKAFIDWDDVHVMPFALAVNFLKDFMTFSTGGMSPDAPYFEEGDFPELPPDELGEVTDPYGNYCWFTFIDKYFPTDDAMRDRRIVNTMRREAYVKALSKYDERVRNRRFWALRKEMLKAHTLARGGGPDWWRRREWLAAQTGSQREGS